jgi:carboxyl-terminal processing protease
MDRRTSAPWRPATLIVLLLPAFVGGILTERYGVLPGAGAHEPPGLTRTFAPFWEAWALVQRDYVDRQAVKPEHMTQGAIKGLLDSLGDQGHTAYLTREEYQQMSASLEGHMEGIGARMTLQHGRVPTVAGIVPGSPAEKAGLRAGDVFLEVDGKDVTEMALDRIVSLVRGPAGTPVRLQVSRDGKKLDIDITRARVQVPSAEWHMLPGEPKVAHLAIQEFGKEAATQTWAALQEATRAGARGLLVDVRGNPGGLKDQAVAVTSLFLKDGTVFIDKDAHGRETPQLVKHEKEGEITDLPLVVLIDGGTASSAEIFAGALQDYGRGKLVGTPTVGTGTVLKPFLLSDDSAVLLAVSQWLTPKGRQIWHKGIEPDVPVTLPAGARILLPDNEANLTESALAKSEDKQLLKALELLRKELH